MRAALFLSFLVGGSCSSHGTAPTNQRVALPAQGSIDAMTAGVETMPASSKPAAFQLALVLEPFGYGSVSVNATTITNWEQPPREMITNGIGLYEGKDPVEVPLADGFEVRYMSRDGTKSGFVIRTLAGMNLECHPSSLDHSEKELHRELCLRLNADAGKLVVPLSFGSQLSLSLGHMFQPRRGSEPVGAHVALSRAREDGPTGGPPGVKAVENRTLPGGFAVVVPGTSSQGTSGYEIQSRQRIGELDVTCNSFAVDLAQAKRALALCTALRAL